MANRSERLIALVGRARKGRRPLMLGGGVLVLGLALWAMGQNRSTAQSVATGEETAMVSNRPFDVRLNLAGTIVAEDGVAVVAPFDGPAKTIDFVYGAHVSVGDVMAVMDAADLAERLAAAQISALRAEQAFSDVSRWQSGPEVARARRATDLASADLDDANRTVEETRRLLDKGLVSRNEYDSALQLRQTRHVALQTANEDLATTLNRGRGRFLRVAGIELNIAQKSWGALDVQYRSRVVRAPISGVVIRPPMEKVEGSGDVRTGTVLRKGQFLALIAKEGSLAVSFEIDEADVNQVAPGQLVTVTGPGFGGVVLSGRIVSIAGDAISSASGPGEKAHFKGVAKLDSLTPEQAATVRIGMSASVSIATYKNASALIVPPQALQGVASQAALRVKDPHTGKIVDRRVRVGRIAPDGVEILAGIKPGETVIWNSPLATPVPVM